MVRQSVREEPWLRDEATQSLINALTSTGEDIRFVGGCVRDSLLGKAATDLDLATPLKPDQVISLLKSHNIKAIPTGIKHGTVTAVINSQHFEITTLRTDVETDGRRAKVAYTEDWVEDAKRRDFTMNAIYANIDGSIYDPCNGLDDLKRGVIRFVGDPVSRIHEDYLRILRYFRFLTFYGTGPIDEPSLSAACSLAVHLESLSGERIWSELSRLLSAFNPHPTIDIMVNHHVFTSTIPEINQIDPLKRLIDLEKYFRFLPNPILRLASLIDSCGKIPQRLKLSNAEKKALKHFANLDIVFADDFTLKAHRKILYRLKKELYKQSLLLFGAQHSMDMDTLQTMLEQSESWQIPTFPLTGRELLQAGMPKSKQLGDRLKNTEQWWIEKDFNPSKKECLDYALSDD
jgi:poly(A) polymerase